MLIDDVIGLSLFGVRMDCEQLYFAVSFWLGYIRLLFRQENISLKIQLLAKLQGQMLSD